MRVVAVVVGLAVVAVWFPLLAAGVASLRSRGRLGGSDVLIVTGPYAYVRHPLYAGLSMTAFGIGLIVGSWPLAVSGRGWLLVTRVWSIREERGLAERFGAEYTIYRQTTPGMIPKVGSLARFRRGDDPRWPG
jgi:protein-S-isoprenylcysteine O-methyltransferase Ste14